jgi:hypothetical protein
VPQQTYEITAPNGKTLEVTGDRMPTEAELHQIFAAAGVETQATPAKSNGPMRRSRTGSLYQSPDDSGASDFASGALSVVNPMTYVRAAKGAYDDPLGAVASLATSPARVLGGLVTEPASTLGSLAMGAALPPMLRGSVRAAGMTPAMTRAALDLNPELVGIISPRLANALKTAKRLKDALGTNAAPAEATAPGRVVGRAPTVNDTLMSALNDLRTPSTTHGELPTMGDAQAGRRCGSAPSGDGSVQSTPRTTSRKRGRGPVVTGGRDKRSVGRRRPRHRRVLSRAIWANSAHRRRMKRYESARMADQSERRSGRKER